MRERRSTTIRSLRRLRRPGWLLVPALGLALVWPALAGDEDMPLIGDLTNGTRLYRTHCSVCHGFDGSGAGPTAVGLPVKPADHRDGSLMNARDNRILFETIRGGCSKCSKAMPAFGSLDDLETWDLVAYLRSLHMPLTFFFPGVDQYLVKSYPLGQVGNKEFKTGQLERLRKHAGKVAGKDLSPTVFTLFKAGERRVSPELVPQEPRRLAELRKENKIGYVLFLELIGPRNKRVPVGLALDLDYQITKLLTTASDPAVAGEYDKRLEKYIGLGKRGDPPKFDISRDKIGKLFDKAATRVYCLAVEGANAYELEERERSWADGTF
ncbi:MAG: cytochrome c [Deltaproteobacteria bacterium]|nr:cytochrome c [Deltaproteobacteria bacterium]